MPVFQRPCTSKEEWATKVFTEHAWRLTIFKALLISQTRTGFHKDKNVTCLTKRSHGYRILKYLKGKITKIFLTVKKNLFFPCCF